MSRASIAEPIVVALLNPEKTEIKEVKAEDPPVLKASRGVIIWVTNEITDRKCTTPGCTRIAKMAELEGGNPKLDKKTLFHEWCWKCLCQQVANCNKGKRPTQDRVGCKKGYWCGEVVDAFDDDCEPYYG